MFATPSFTARICAIARGFRNLPQSSSVPAFLAFLLLPFFLAASALAQLPPEAVDLAKVKIPETIKPADLCPVHLVPSLPDGPAWEHGGVSYRGSAPDAAAAFAADPAKYVDAANRKRWETNFVQAMSRVWCPVTDQVNPGGLTEWKAEGLTWESCCTFCTQTVRDEDFPAALDRLKERARLAYELTGGVYVEGAKSPVEGAIRTPETGPAADCGAEPAWLQGVELQPTYTGGVGLIFDRRCIECHRAGGLSPINFQSYAGIKQWSKNMKESLQTGKMPPWPADPAVGCFSNSRRLTQKELDLLTAWADARFPQGEGAHTPTVAFDSEWTIGEPDAVLTLPEYTLAEDATAVTREFEIATAFPEDRWIIATEIKPEDPFLVIGVEGGPLGAYYPGNPAELLPQGAAHLLKAGEKVAVRVHFFKEAGYEATDAVRFGLRFSKEAAPRQARLSVARNEAFTIPPGADNHEVRAELALAEDARIISLLPNLGERGKSAECLVVLPDGTEQKLLSIPTWRHKWRMRYQLAEPFAAPKGAILRMIARYDNSSMNVDNPDPEAEVKAGPGGEVCELWIGTVAP